VKILVTGGVGFVGGYTAKYLAEKGFDVVVVDSMERCSRFYVDILEKLGIPIARSDVKVYECCRGFDVVIHAAAYISVAESIEKPVEYIDNNVVSTAAIAYKAAKSMSKFIYISSASVYGNPVKLPIPENHPLNPLSPYGLSKLLGELVVMNFGKVYGLRYSILRLFNVYGPGQSRDYAGVVSIFIERALKNLPLVIYGDGNQTRDFIYVKDVAEVITKFIEKDLFVNDVYNVGTGRPISINELARKVMDVVGRDVDVVYQPERPGDIRHSYADNKKLLSVINIDFTPIDTGLRYTVDFYRTYLENISS
jgi:UDP-glucose 4-epimerase